MKLVTWMHRGETHIGALVSKNGSDFVCALNRLRPGLPDEMVAFLRAGDATMASAKSAVSAARENELVPLSGTKLLAPVPRPGKIICVGHNYHDHAGDTPPAFPDIFGKFANVVVGPHETILLARASDQIDYEGELAVVIGRRAKYVSEANALDAVAGYTIFNDVTARDYQKRSSQWTLGKSFDTFGPMGPALVTKDEIGEPSNLELTLWVNGEQRQHTNTRDLIFSIPFLISYLSQAITLEPGDIISTGTPSGTGASHKPPVFLKQGDQVRVAIEKIGELVNPVAIE
ncbi:MAG TPA: fumarylacetoacetate hydrolase family protein [Anaerolineae bacterium]